MTVTATKTIDATGTTVQTASFSIAQPQSVVWDATYTGSATQGHSYYLTTNSQSNLADIFITNGGAHGTKPLSPGTYYISIKLGLMGPGFYSIKFDPTGDGSTLGDPHITTVNGVHYDFQSVGEFVALRGDALEIQTRQEPVSSAATLTDPYSGLSTGVAINTAIAVKIGGHRATLQFDPGSQSTDSRLKLRIDGHERVLPATGISLDDKDRISPSDGSFRFDFADGTILLVTPQWWAPQHRWYIDLSVQRTTAHMGTMGIIAERDWLPALPDGSRIGPRPQSLIQRYGQLYGKFANAWRVTSQSSLFDYGPGQSIATFTRHDWPRMHGPFKVPGSQATPMTPAPIAETACRLIRDAKMRRECIFDVRIMGDPGVANNYDRMQRARRQLKLERQ